MHQNLLRCSILLLGFFLIGTGLAPVESRTKPVDFFAASSGTDLCAINLTGKDLCLEKDAAGILLPEGTRITLELYDDVSSKSSTVGQLVMWGVYKAVKGVNNNGDQVELIAPNAYADGKVTIARKGGVFGRPGRVGVNVSSVEAVDGQRIPVYCRPLEAQGKSKRALAWCLGIGLSLVGIVLFSTLTNGGGLFLVAVLPMFLGLVISGKNVKMVAKSTRIEVTVQRDMMIKA